MSFPRNAVLFGVASATLLICCTSAARAQSTGKQRIDFGSSGFSLVYSVSKESSGDVVVRYGIECLRQTLVQNEKRFRRDGDRIEIPASKSGASGLRHDGNLVLERRGDYIHYSFSSKTWNKYAKFVKPIRFQQNGKIRIPRGQTKTDYSKVRRRVFMTNSGSTFAPISKGSWLEKRVNGPSSRFRQLPHSDYVLLYDSSRHLYVRLLSRSAEARAAGNSQWRPWPGSNGTWR